jgi:hypothetical protein
VTLADCLGVEASYLVKNQQVVEQIHLVVSWLVGMNLVVNWQVENHPAGKYLVAFHLVEKLVDENHWA